MQIRKSIALLSAIIALAALTGCASLPPPEVMKAEAAAVKLPKMPDEGKAMVYVVRPSAMGTLVRFNVFLDDQQDASEMGFNRGSQYIYFHVTPGTHKIYSKAENWADAEVTVQAGDVVFIEQQPAMGLIMARNTITKVEDYQGKYHMKSLTQGTIIKTDK